LVKLDRAIFLSLLFASGLFGVIQGNIVFKASSKAVKALEFYQCG